MCDSNPPSWRWWRRYSSIDFSRSYRTPSSWWLPCSSQISLTSIEEVYEVVDFVKVWTVEDCSYLLGCVCVCVCVGVGFWILFFPLWFCHHVCTRYWYCIYRTVSMVAYCFFIYGVASRQWHTVSMVLPSRKYYQSNFLSNLGLWWHTVSMAYCIYGFN